MKRQQVIWRVALLAAVLYTSSALAQDSFPIYRPWKGMYSSSGEELGLILHTGAFLRGKAVAIRPDGIEMEVKKTSDPTAYPKKRLVIPRANVDEIELYEFIGRGNSDDSREIALAGKTSAIGIAGALGSKLGGVRGLVMGGVLGNLGGVLGSVAIRRKGARTEEEIIRIRIVPDDAQPEPIPAEVLASGDELLRQRHQLERTPLQAEERNRR
jgi:hypothetical protein